MHRLFSFRALLVLAVAACLTGCAGTGGGVEVGETEHGYASWYGSENGSHTASGEHFNPQALTAAHRRLPFGSIVRVTNEENGKSVDVRINDRGPFAGGRIIDVSSAAAEELGMKTAGVVRVELDVLSVGDGRRVN